MSPLEHGEGASASSALIAGGVVGLEMPEKVNWRGQYNAYKGRVGDLMATGSIGSVSTILCPLVSTNMTTARSGITVPCQCRALLYSYCGQI